MPEPNPSQQIILTRYRNEAPVRDLTAALPNDVDYSQRKGTKPLG